MQINGRLSRGVAVLAGAVLASSALLLPMQGAQAADKSKTYKTGAIALGVLGAYFGIKGKTVPAVIAGAGAYYAYKKSKDVKREESASSRTSSNPTTQKSDDIYADARDSQARRETSASSEDVFPDSADANQLPADDATTSASTNDLGYVGLTAKSEPSKNDSAANTPVLVLK